ncbi:FAD/NAD(P)-binding domain-containing protein [Thozetella sp. PMI_491]|nr:FAD/NAD(P)-binding domain-containing protein [Thozetella sp. PMI_491]
MMGIFEAVKEARVPEPGMQIIDLQGKVKANFPAYQTNSSKQGPTSDFEIMRGDLVHILYDATSRHGVRYLFDASIESFTQEDEDRLDGKVHVRLSGGSEDDYDLVVGADGLSSHTRRLMLGPSAPDPRFSLGLHIAFFTIKSQPGDSNSWQFCHLPGRRIVMTRQDRPGVLRVYMLIQGERPTLEAAYGGSILAQKKAWADLFRDAGWQTNRFVHELEHSHESDDLYTSHAYQIRLHENSWSKGRMVLLGDAAHCPAPLGLGTTLALAGAYVLAGEIATRYKTGRSRPGDAVLLGVKSYETTLRPLIETAQDINPKQIVKFFPEALWRIRFMQAAAGVAAFLRLHRVGAMLPDKQEKWKLPQYPVLEN